MSHWRSWAIEETGERRKDVEFGGKRVKLGGELIDGVLSSVLMSWKLERKRREGGDNRSAITKYGRLDIGVAERRIGNTEVTDKGAGATEGKDFRVTECRSSVSRLFLERTGQQLGDNVILEFHRGVDRREVGANALAGSAAKRGA
jgi:hypothetical protein